MEGQHIIEKLIISMPRLITKTDNMMLDRLHFKHTREFESRQYWKYSRQPNESLTEAGLFRHND